MNTPIIVNIMSIAVCVFMSAAVTAASVPLLHILQLESYQGKMFFKWLKKRAVSECVPYLFAGLAALFLKIAYPFLGGNESRFAFVVYSLSDFVYIAILAVLFFSYIKKKHAKPIKYTGRVIRLMAVELVIAFFFSVLFFMPLYGWMYQMDWWTYISPFIVRYAPGMFMPLLVFAAFFITYPVEAAIKAWYFNDGKRKLAEHKDIIRIGITGSFGKTGTKYALEKMMATQHNVLMTPGSFNTPMGVTRVIREQLRDDHDVFIAEMGARYKGDIKELCRLVNPEYGIIIAIGKQHLETFGSLDAVRNTKGELLENVGTFCFLNGDDENCRMLCDRTEREKYGLFGIESDGLYMRAANIRTDSCGSRFELIAGDGNSIECTTKLLGTNNVMDITAAAALAYKLGITFENIAKAVETLEPVEHRLQLMPGVVNVIDDAFNANPVGSKEAMDVLNSFDAKRIVITPGLVELGDEEDKLNRELGKYMAERTDVAIIIGKKHADPICEGLVEGGFDKRNLVRASSLAEATELLKNYTVPGCVVLFENDLPDNYNE